MSKKHLEEFANKFVGRHIIRELDTIEQVQYVVAGVTGKRLMYAHLVKGEEWPIQIFL